MVPLLKIPPITDVWGLVPLTPTPPSPLIPGKHRQTDRVSIAPQSAAALEFSQTYIWPFLWRYPTKSENENVEFSKKSSLAILHVFNVFSESALAEPHFDVNSTEAN